MASFTSSHISYKDTGAFGRIVTDYLEGKELLRPFYNHTPVLEGIKKAIAERKLFNNNRSLLREEFKNQYAGVDTSDAVHKNIDALAGADTFTICTAHEPNIFTGHLYFIYKIVHAIRLAADLEEKIPGCRFVPVYYMGSEDADLEELGEVVIDGKKYEWKTNQKGAVGRMLVDKSFITIIDSIEGQLMVLPFGKEVMKLIRDVYVIGKTIEQATFELVNHLFGKYGLLVFLPDNPVLKKEFESINRKELQEVFSHPLVKETIEAFPAEYKVQAAGREINLFYLKDDKRERIEKIASGYAVANTAIRFSKEEICKELTDHPERFSPNVILRPVFQELILPNVVFIGGGGELAYWLELKRVFEAVSVPFPVLVLRNSFLVVTARVEAIIKKLGLSDMDVFRPLKDLQDSLVSKESNLQLQLDAEKKKIQEAYDAVEKPAVAIDPTLKKHVEALRIQALHRISLLEKKMLKAEKKKFEASLRQLDTMKQHLFPDQTLQERIDNLLPYYAKWGSAFIDEVFEQSKGLDGDFCLLHETA